jgi:hypothetical protein
MFGSHGIFLSSLVVALAIFFDASPVTSQVANMRSYVIPNRGTLEMAVPTSWKDAIRQPSAEVPPTISFSPREGNAFRALITPLWQAIPQPGFSSAENIRAFLEQQGRKALASAVETRLILEELRAQSGVGYYYSLTDRAPKPGEFTYLTQGALGVGDLLISFTLLHREKEPPERQAVLEMLRSAVHRPR